MEKYTDGEPEVNKKSVGSRIWLCVISGALSVAIVAVACLGAAVLVSNTRLTALQADLSAANANIEALQAENGAASTEITALQGDLALKNESIESLSAELAATKETLTQATQNEESLEGKLTELASELAATKESLTQSTQNEESLEKKVAELQGNVTALENTLTSLEGGNQSSQSEIDQLKSDIAKANDEIAALKEQLAEKEESEGKIKIYIDQGHNPSSFHNSGATGNGLYEQDVTFLVGCVLAELLREDGRFEVELSRPNKSVVLGTDNNSSLMARVEGATAFDADFFISLHTNSFGQDTANGIEIYYVGDTTGESYFFGNTLLNELVESTGLRNRGMKSEENLVVLKNATMPAVLVEMGFISNSTDAALMSEHPELFAQGIYNGMLDYFGLLPKIQG